MISEEAMQRMKAKVQQRVGATPPATWAKVGVGVLVGGVAIGWIAFPYVLDKVVASQINLAQGRDSRRLWVQLPTLGCNLYVFNVTNPAEVMRGAKPIVQQIGPYCYKEVKDKTDFVEDPSTDTISYSARSTWYEDQRGPDCPTPHLTGDEVVTVPNVPILSILLIAEKDFPAPFLTLVSQALPAIFGRVNDLFMRVTVRSLLFDGILINCTATALYPRAVCIALKQNSRSLKKLSENVYTFSFFGAKNHTPEEFRYTVKRGTVDGQEIGRLVAIDGKPELPFWRGDCNKLQGTDASVFPPFRKMENGSLLAYSSEACRIIFGIYEGEATYKGVNGYIYTALPFGDVETNPGDRCYCPADDRCRKKGVLDALKCQGAPIVASHPHFYQGSQQYVDGVVGLKPEKEKHEIRIILEPISGTPLVARKRIQFNIELKPIRFVPLTQRLRRSLVPLFWAEETLDLDGNLMGLLEASLFRPIRAVDVIKWLCVVGGVGLGVLGVVLKVKQYRRDKVHVINGEAGGGFGYESNPKSALKPEQIDGDTELLDPFYIKTEDNPERNGKIINGQLAETFKKSASTITTLNASRPASLSKLDVKRLLGQGYVSEVAGNTLATNQSQANYPPTSMLPDKEKSKIPDGSGNFGDLVNGQSDRAENETLETPMNPSSANIPQNSPTHSHFHSPKIVASLEHQMSFKNPINSNHSLNQAYNEPMYELPITNQTNASDGTNAGSEYGGPRDTVIYLGDSENTTDSELNQTTDLQTTTNNSITLENAFGGSMVEDIQSMGDSPDKINSENKTIANKVTSDETSTHTAGGHREAFNYEIKPSEEEIQAVEEDINKLMAEMAELLPRNKGFAVSDSTNSNS